MNTSGAHSHSVAPDLALQISAFPASGPAPADGAERPVLGTPLPMYSSAEFALVIDRSLANCRRRRNRLTVLTLRIDQVSRVDEAGHVVAEPSVSLEHSVLERCARRLQSRLRATDQVVRIDSRHIGVVLVGAGDAEARAVDVRLSQALRGPYRFDADLLALRLGIGRAVYPGQGLTGKELAATAVAAAPAPSDPG